MRMLLKVSVPVEQGSRTIANGVLPKTMIGFIEQYRPEAAYFVAERGCRTGYFFFDLEDTVSIPSLAEPFFMELGASIELTPAMNPAEMREGVERAMKAR